MLDPNKPITLLEDKVVELNIVPQASDNTIGRTLKKYTQAPPERAIRRLELDMSARLLINRPIWRLVIRLLTLVANSPVHRRRPREEASSHV